VGGKLRTSEWVLIVAIVIMAILTAKAWSDRPGASAAPRQEAPARAPSLVDPDLPI